MSTPFTLNISDEQLERVKCLAKDCQPELDAWAANTLTSADPQDESIYGIRPEKLQALVKHLTTDYDWRANEKRFNDMGEQAHLSVQAGGEDLSLHYVHKRSSRASAIPLLLCHGWPGSVWEFEGIIPLLTEPKEGQAFHVVACSIPGYTFSSAPKQSPLQLETIAKCFNSVMQHLGYTKYVVQGGDWGSIISRAIAYFHQDACRAMHLNFYMHSGPNISTEGLPPDEKRGVERGVEFREKGSAYAMMQGTTPYTLGAALSMSPVALLAYIAEKFYRWSAPDSQPSMDDIITNVLLYWFSKNITSSFWLYYNRIHGGDIFSVSAKSIEAPTAVSVGPYELHWPPRSKMEKEVNLQSFEVVSNGGHFLAMERPALLAEAMRRHFGQKEVVESLS